MKFTKQVLIERVKDEIKRREADAAEFNMHAEHEYARSLTDYLASTKDAWNDFANTIKRRVRAGLPVTAKDVPPLLAGDRQGWAGPRGAWVLVWGDKGPVQHTADTVALNTLLALLQSTTTEEVTTTELERMGFKMSRLFRT